MMPQIFRSNNTSDSKLEKGSNTVIRCLQIITPFLKPGGKTVSVILALGLAYLPLRIDGNPYVAVILATAAAAVALVGTP